MLVFLGGQKSELVFLGFSWPGLCHCPTGRVSVSRESESVGSDRDRRGQYYLGVPGYPAAESSCSKGWETRWGCVGLALDSFKLSDHLNM